MHDCLQRHSFVMRCVLAHELNKSKTQRIVIGPKSLIWSKTLISSVSISPSPAPVPFLSCMSEVISSLLVMRLLTGSQCSYVYCVCFNRQRTVTNNDH